MHPGLPYQHVLEEFGEAFNVDGLADTYITWESKGKILEAVVDRAKWCIGLHIQHQDTERYQQLIEGVRDIISANTTDTRYATHSRWALGVSRCFLDKLCSILDKAIPSKENLQLQIDNSVHESPNGNTSSTKRRISEVSTGLARVDKGKGKETATSVLEAQGGLGIAPLVGPVVAGGDVFFHPEQTKGAISGYLPKCAPKHLTQQFLDNIKKAQQIHLSPAQRVQLNLCISQASHFISGPKITLLRSSPRFHINPHSKAQLANENLVKGCQNIMSKAASRCPSPSLASINQLVTKAPSSITSRIAPLSTSGAPPTKKIKPNGAVNSEGAEIKLAHNNTEVRPASSVSQPMLSAGSELNISRLQKNPRTISLEPDIVQGGNQDDSCRHKPSNLQVAREVLPQYNPTGFKECNSVRSDMQILNTYIDSVNPTESSHPGYPPTPQTVLGDGMVNEQRQSIQLSESYIHSGMLPPPVPFISPAPSGSPQSPVLVLTNSGRGSGSEETVISRNLQRSTALPAATLPVYHSSPALTPQTGTVYSHQQLNPHDNSNVPIYTSSHSSPSPSGIDFGASEDFSDIDGFLNSEFYQDLLGESWFPDSSLGGHHQEEQFEPSIQTLVYQSENLQDQPGYQ